MSLFKKIFGRSTMEKAIENNIPKNDTAIKSESKEDKANAVENTPNKNIKRFQTKVAGVTYARRQSHLRRLAKKIENDFVFPDI